MAKRRRKEPPATVDYTDAEGNVLTLRESLSSGSIREIAKARASGAATVDDDYQRRSELLFERLAVRWEIAGLPLKAAEAPLGPLPDGRLADPALGPPDARRPRCAADPRARGVAPAG